MPGQDRRVQRVRHEAERTAWLYDCFITRFVPTLQLIHDAFHTRYRALAAYSTGNRILIAIRNVTVRRFSAMFDQLRKERGQPFLSGQLDLWSLGLGT